MNRLLKAGISLLGLSFIVLSVQMFNTSEIISAASQSWNQWVLNVRSPSTIGGYKTGTPEKDGQLMVESDLAARDVLVLKMAASHTADALEIQNSAGSVLASIDKDGDLTAVAGTFSGAMSFASDATYTKQVAVDQTDTYTDVIALDIDGSTATSVDVVNFALGSTEYFSITSAGQVDIANVLAVTGAATMGSTLGVTGAVTASSTLAVTNEATFAKGATMDGVSADPCAGAQYSPGSVFYNETDGIMCYCDQNLQDLKIDGSSASCGF